MGKTVKGTPIAEFNGIAVNTSIPCDSRNYYSYSDRYVDYIVIHYTGNSKDTAVANVKYFNSGSRGASAHYFVDENNCYQSVSLNNAAWAVGGTNNYKHASCRNKNSISIEMCCSNNYTVSEQTINNTAHLCAKLCNLLGISAEDVDKYVLRHYDVWSKSCPAQWASVNNDGWTGFKEQVKNILIGNEGLNMSQYNELKAMIESLQVENAILKQENADIKAVLENTFIYNWVDDNMPSWAKDAVTAAMQSGAVQGDENGRLNLSYKDLRQIVREYRQGLYDKPAVH